MIMYLLDNPETIKNKYHKLFFKGHSVSFVCFELLNPLDDGGPYADHGELLDDKQASIILVENLTRSNATKRIRRKTNR